MTDEAELEPTGDVAGNRVGKHAALCGLLLLLGLFANYWTLRQGILGFDSYIQVGTSRIESGGDFVDSFTQPLTDGRIVARFYRPIQNLSIALDYAIWELNAFGYQLSSLIAYGLALVLVYLTSVRIMGPASAVGAFVATAFWALHPVLVNVLPIPCRRSDMLVTAFLCLALLCLPRAAKRASLGATILAGVFVFLAAGAKDIGVMGLGLIFGYRLLVGSEGESRWRSAARDSIPALVAALIYMGARTAVLRGFGGYLRGEDDPGSYLGRVQNFGTSMLADVFYPAEFLPSALKLGEWGRDTAGLVLGALLLVLALWFITTTCVGRRAELGGAAILICIGLAWLIPPVITLGHMKWDAPWYAVHPLVGVAFVTGGVAQCAVIALRGEALQKLEGAIAGVVALAALVCGLRFSPLWADYPEWDVATGVLEATLSELDEKLSTAQLGDQVHLRNTPYPELPAKPDGLNLRWIATIDRKGMQAWAEMRYPELNTRTKLFKQKLINPRQDDEVIIVVNNLGDVRH